MVINLFYILSFIILLISIILSVISFVNNRNGIVPGPSPPSPPCPNPPCPPGPPGPPCPNPPCPPGPPSSYDIPTFMYDYPYLKETDSNNIKLTSNTQGPDPFTGRIFSTKGYKDAFKNNLNFEWTMDLSDIRDKKAIISTAYLVFPLENNPYYCDMGFESIINGHCMEIDLLEITGNKCIQSTYHDCANDCNYVGGDKQGDSYCGQNGCLSNFTLNNNESLLKFNAQLSDNGTFKLNINGQSFIPKKPSNTAIQNILDTSSKNPAVLVFSVWTASDWFPGKTGDCTDFSADFSDGNVFSITISDVKVSTTNGSVITTDFPQKFPKPPPTCPPPKDTGKCNCNWANVKSCNNNTSDCGKICCVNCPKT